RLLPAARDGPDPRDLRRLLARVRAARAHRGRCGRAHRDHRAQARARARLALIWAARRPGAIGPVPGPARGPRWRWGNPRERGDGMKARDVMSSPVVFLRPQVPTDVAAALLLSHGYSAAPVVDDDGRVVGITTEADLLRGRFHPDRWEIDTGPEPPVGEVMTRDPICLGPDA